MTRRSIEGDDTNNEQLLSIIEEVARGRIFADLELYGNRITNTGCEVLATMLRDPNCNLYTLNLHDNDIGHEGAIVIANSLANNKKLEKLIISHNTFDDTETSKSIVQDAFVRLLCNTENINSTYSSNHTLNQLQLSLCNNKNLTPQLGSLLTWNMNMHKSYVAIKKILLCHPNIDMEQLFGWDLDDEQSLKSLPYVIDWFSRAEEAVAEDSPSERFHHVPKFEYSIDQRKLSAIYQFARSMPLQFVSDMKVDKKKRKRIE